MSPAAAKLQPIGLQLLCQRRVNARVAAICSAKKTAHVLLMFSQSESGQEGTLTQYASFTPPDRPAGHRVTSALGELTLLRSRSDVALASGVLDDVG